MAETAPQALFNHFKIKKEIHTGNCLCKRNLVVHRNSPIFYQCIKTKFLLKNFSFLITTRLSSNTFSTKIDWVQGVGGVTLTSLVVISLALQIILLANTFRTYIKSNPNNNSSSSSKKYS